MAFQSIVTGAECSSGANPMTQIMKQFNEDRSLQKDAFIPARDSVGPSTFRTVKQELAGENKFANDFFDQRDHGQIVSVDAPHSLHVIENQRHQLAHPEWVTEFDSAITAAEHAKMEEAFKRMNVGGNPILILLLLWFIFLTFWYDKVKIKKTPSVVLVNFKATS